MKANTRPQLRSIRRTWTLIADRSRALIYQTNGNSTPKLVEDVDHPEGRLKDGSINADRPGRTKDRKGAGKHAFGKEFGPSKMVAIQFAKELAANLEKAANRGDFEDLVLVAPPSFLGLIRDELGTSSSRRLAASIRKDLVTQSAAERKLSLKRLLEKI